MNYTSISLYRKVISHALAEGMTRDDLKVLTPFMDLMHEIKAVPVDDFFELHEKLDERLGSGFSIRVGQEMKIEDYGVLGLSWRTCSWAGEIFERCERYFKLLSDTYVFQVEDIGSTSTIYLHRDAHRKGVELSNEATFSATVVVLQAMTEKPINPIHVAFKHSPPKRLDDYSKAFQCPVHFNQESNYMTYATNDLRLRTAKADASINHFLVERVEEEMKGMEISASKIISDAEILIKNVLPSGIPGIVQIGEHMGMSNRTLTRRLSEEGTTFRNLIKKIQEEVAKDLLNNSSRNIAEIAFETGFSEQSAFNRAFKRWTGLSPLEFRKN